MTDAELDAIEARADAATPGPWVCDNRVGCAAIYPGTEKVNCFHDIDTTVAANDTALDAHGLADWEFMAHARADVPALVAEVRRLRAECHGWTADTKDHYFRQAERMGRVGRENDRLRAALAEVLRVGTPGGNDLATVWGHGTDAEPCRCTLCAAVRERQAARDAAAAALGEG